jgi:hypothetical protein
MRLLPDAYHTDSPYPHSHYNRTNLAFSGPDAAKVLTMDEARRVASNIAKLPTPLGTK